ncbi:AMP-binding protein [Streptomyces sp. L06]|nr:AMP-binding protein [Streptomyces sp. L06]
MTGQGGIGLSVGMLLRRAATVAPHKEVREVGLAGQSRGTSWAALQERVRRLVDGLRNLGVGHGSTVTTFAWNSTRHLEWFFGVPMAGAVLAPVNVRFSGDQIEWVVTHAESQVMVVDASLTPSWPGCCPGCGRSAGSSWSPTGRGAPRVRRRAALRAAARRRRSGRTA